MVNLDYLLTGMRFGWTVTKQVQGRLSRFNRKKYLCNSFYPKIVHAKVVSSGCNSCFLSWFCSTGVYSHYTSSFHLRHKSLLCTFQCQEGPQYINFSFRIAQGRINWGCTFLRYYNYLAYTIVDLFLSGIYHFWPFFLFSNFFKHILEHINAPFSDLSGKTKKCRPKE